MKIEFNNKTEKNQYIEEIEYLKDFMELNHMFNDPLRLDENKVKHIINSINNSEINNVGDKKIWSQKNNRIL